MRGKRGVHAMRLRLLTMIPGLYWASSYLPGRAVLPDTHGERPRHNPMHWDGPCLCSCRAKMACFRQGHAYLCGVVEQSGGGTLPLRRAGVRHAAWSVVVPLSVGLWVSASRDLGREGDTLRAMGSKQNDSGFSFSWLLACSRAKRACKKWLSQAAWRSRSEKSGFS